ncbi:MAG: glycoside hydrolase family 3 C-terminal domain-containing protein [Pseudomonadota bacterium]|nr:glycoside hydrolase family 3 C-terminal domain-containing protein [Pseudomonadota bacterium]
MKHHHTLARLAAFTLASAFFGHAMASGQVTAPVTPDAATLAASAATCPWMDTTKTPDQRARLLLDNSTLDQAMRWLNEATANYGLDTVIEGATYPQQVPCVKFDADVDGQWGIAYIHGTTAFPVPVAQAASWDIALTRKKGAAMAAEAWGKQYNLIFAPGVDIVRHPWGGRNAEYLGEDPFLAGTLAGAWVTALRESNPGQPVASVMKHFVGNQQELDRAASSSNIDERTLHEIYLMPYAMAFQSAPAGVMCGFNQLNGVFACENPTLLTRYLRDELDFKGYAVTDNGAQHSTAAALVAGLSQELSLPQYFKAANLRTALNAKQITEDQIRAAAFWVLRAKFATGLMDQTLPDRGRDDEMRTEQHHAVAREMAEKGSVLLKNDNNMLPLKLAGKRIAVIGPTASNVATNGVSAQLVCTSPLYGAAGAPPVIYDCGGTSALDAITARAAQDGNTVVFDDGSDLAKAARTAASVDTVIVFGYNTTGEFFDLPNLNLFSDGDALIAAVAAANPKTTVILQTAGPVLMPWVNSVPAVMETWWSGDAGGDAIASLLFGDVNPSGKLPVTFMKNLADLPTGGTPNERYPGIFANGSTTRPDGSGEIRQVNYKEGLQVGYRWYDKQQIAPLFAFGHGLSYTSFAYADLQVSAAGAQGFTVSFTIKNTGKVAGAEVPQVYLTLPAAAAEPAKRLVGFDRVELAPGEARTVQVTIDGNASNHPFSVWNTQTAAWRIINGDHMVSIGASSRDLRLQKTARVNVPEPTVVDVTPAVKVVQSGFVANRVTGKYTGTISFTNTSGAALNGPLNFRLDNLLPGVTLENRTGMQGDAPYITLPGGIAAGATVSVTTIFTNPSKGSFAYKPKLFSGTF